MTEPGTGTALASFAFVGGELRGTQLALHPTCLVHRGNTCLETLPLAGMTAVRVSFERNARRLQLPELARIHGIGSAFEKANPDNDESAFEAAGLTVALRRALELLGDEKSDEKVGWMLSDLTFEMREVYEWQAVAARHQRYFGDPQHADFPAHRLGHMGAAALPLCLTLAAEAWRAGFAPHERAVVTVGSDTGERAAVLASAGRTAAPRARELESPAAG